METWLVKWAANKMLRVASLLMLLLALTACAWGVYRILSTKTADFTVDVQTRRMVLVLSGNYPPFIWRNLELVMLDGRKHGCAVKVLPLGAYAVRITALKYSKKPSASIDAKADAHESDLYLQIELPPDAQPVPIACDGKPTAVAIGSALFLVKDSRRAFPFIGSVVVGGLLDFSGGSFETVVSGKIRASARVRRASYPAAFNDFDLRPGDEVQFSNVDASPAMMIGLFVDAEDNLSVVAYASGIQASLKRAGFAQANDLQLRPGIGALLQADTTWSLLALLFSVLSGLFALIEKFKKGKEKK